MKEFISRTCISFTGKLTVLTEELREEFLWLHGGPTNSVFQKKVILWRVLCRTEVATTNNSVIFWLSKISYLCLVYQLTQIKGDVEEYTSNDGSENMLNNKK